MRITSEMLSSSFLYDLSNNLNNMAKDQKQMATGTKISVPSDDPLGTSKVMNINSEIDQNTQYSTNISDATKTLNVTDTTLGQINSVLQRVNELLLSTGNAAYGATQLSSVKDEINQNISNLSQLLNTNYAGKYIFAGTSYDTKPTGTSTDATTKDTSLNYVGSDGITAVLEANVGTDTQVSYINSDLPVEISQGVTISSNVTAGDVMNYSSTSNLRTLLSNITSHLNDGATNTTSRADLVGSDLTGIQDAIKNVSSVTTRVGALQNRMKSASTQNEAQNTSLTEALSSVDDIDYADASMNYSQAQTVYQAALQTSAKILQKSLLDYL
jgi:flagellar hook-associated protein 3 FlgL